jgi:hypothetical protein
MHVELRRPSDLFSLHTMDRKLAAVINLNKSGLDTNLYSRSNITIT